MKIISRALTAIAALLMIAGLSAPAMAGNSTLFSSTKGDIVFPLSPPTSSASGNLDNTIIGATTPVAGTFTTLTSSSGISGPVSATTLSASGAVSLNPTSHNVVLSPTGTGVVTIAPATVGTMDNVAIGSTTAAAGTFTSVTSTGAIAGPVSATTLGASGAVTLSPASAAVAISPTGTGTVTINPATASAMNNVIIGATTPVAGSFTTLKGASIAFSGTAPTVTGTGTPTIVATSTDNAGEVTAGASATSVVITFATAKTNAPFCVVTSQTQLVAFAYTISTTAITITQTATSGNLIDYHCVQH